MTLLFHCPWENADVRRAEQLAAETASFRKDGSLAHEVFPARQY